MKFHLSVFFFPFMGCVITVTGFFSSMNSMQTPSLLGSSLYTVYFVNERIGWVAGELGTVLKTTDGGDNWIPQNSGTKEEILSIWFVDSLSGWGVGSKGTVINTKDGGVVWQKQYSGTRWCLNSVMFVNDSCGWAVGEFGKIIKTSDRGINWISQKSIEKVDLNSVWFIDKESGWIAGDGGIILHTSNGGINWVLQKKDTSAINLESIRFVNEKIGWAGGVDYNSAGIVFKTTDGGNIWNICISNDLMLLMNVEAMSFVDENCGFILTQVRGILKVTVPISVDTADHLQLNLRNQGNILETPQQGSQNSEAKITECGEQIEKISFFLDKRIDKRAYSVFFINRECGWVVGSYGILRRTKDGGKSWTN